MGRSPCCEKVGMKKGPWTPEEDQNLLAYIELHGHGSWRALPAKAGLQRCGKSCRLRWTNYLRPDIKRGKFSLQEQQTIIQLHALLGNRWSAIATHLPKRTDNEIKNYWNTHLKKRLAKMGIDPATHKPKSETLDTTHSKSAANLSHMAQWESARLEAEARLVRESKLRAAAAAISSSSTSTSSSSSAPPHQLDSISSTSKDTPPCPDILGALQSPWSSKLPVNGNGGRIDLESPTSTLSLSENLMIPAGATRVGPLESSILHASPLCREQGVDDDDQEFDQANKCKCFSKRTEDAGEMQLNFFATNNTRQVIDPKMDIFNGDFLMINNYITETSGDGSWLMEASTHMLETGPSSEDYGDGSTRMLLHNSDEHEYSPERCGDSENGESCMDEEENKSYWNSILDMVNSSPPDTPPPVF